MDERDEAWRHPAIWIRLGVMALLFVMLAVAGPLLAALALIQWFHRLLRDRPHAEIARFGDHLGAWLDQSARYLAGSARRRPFPFEDGDLPRDDPPPGPAASPTPGESRPPETGAAMQTPGGERSPATTSGSKKTGSKKSGSKKTGSGKKKASRKKGKKKKGTGKKGKSKKKAAGRTDAGSGKTGSSSSDASERTRSSSSRSDA